MQTFKLRAESPVDLTRLRSWLECWHHRVSRWEVTPDPDFPDVTLVFDSDATIEELRNACAHVPDGHVMEETVEPIALYTGERTYGQRKIV